MQETDICREAARSAAARDSLGVCPRQLLPVAPGLGRGAPKGPQDSWRRGEDAAKDAHGSMGPENRRHEGDSVDKGKSFHQATKSDNNKRKMINWTLSKFLERLGENTCQASI